MGCVIVQPHVQLPPLGPSKTVDVLELGKHDAVWLLTKPTSVHPPVGTT